jgi:3,4-dihydroxy-9,10-secoandrosta-1,3,5(10)-triene-9,17-dione 4,5-dioxygenase
MKAVVRQAGYAEISATDVSAWARLGEMVGCGVVELEDGAIGLRIDEDRRSRIQVRPADADRLVCFGWETDGPAEFRAIYERLEKAGGNPVMRPELAALRQVQEVASFVDPDGFGGEIYWGMQSSLRKTFKSPQHVAFMAGPNGFGHVAMLVRDLSRTIAFYTEALGMRLTEIFGVGTLKVGFFHANERHHSFAAAEKPELAGTIDHICIEVAELDHLGAIRDRMMANGHPIARDLGRHPGDGVISLYARTPAPFHLEIGWGSVPVTEDWDQARFSRSGGAWGHQDPLDMNVKLGEV